MLKLYAFKHIDIHKFLTRLKKKIPGYVTYFFGYTFKIIIIKKYLNRMSYKFIFYKVS